MKITLRLILLCLALICLAGTASVQAQSQLLTVGMFPLQDESASQLPQPLLDRIGRELRQKLTMTYQDVLVRPLKETSPPPDGGGEQLAAMARQQGVGYLLRPGILGVQTEGGEQEARVDVALYAELISGESGTVTSLRANGSATGSAPEGGDPLSWSAYDFGGRSFSSSALGQALTNAIELLTQQVRQALSPSGQESPESAAVEPPPQETAIDDQSAQSYEADQELQQLLSQADALVAGGIASGRDIAPLQQSLEGLRNALNSKVNLMTEGQDSSAADQEIERYKGELQQLISASAQEEALQPPPGESQPMTSELSSGMSRINELLGEALNSILKIQEINTALQTFRQDQETPPAEGSDESYVPVEEPTSDVSGVVADDSGNPVEGATVTDPESGISTTTDSSGSYILPRIPSSRFATIKVIKAGKQLSMGKIQLQPGRMALADWRIGSGGTGLKTSGIRILPANIIIPATARRSLGGTIKGVVRNAAGQPVARALVLVKGVGMARTDSRGAYLFANLPPGSYQVTVRQGGAPPQTERVRVTALKVAESATLYQGSPAASPSTKRSAILLSNSSGSTLRGTVSNTNGQPLPGAKVTAILSGSALTVMTNSGGAYAFKGLKQGSYRLLASKAGYQESAGSVSLRAGRNETRDFRLERSSLVIRPPLKTISPRPAVATTGAGTLQRSSSPASGRLTGVVRDSQSRAPLEGAQVQLFGKRPGPSDRQGIYRISDITPGRYRVTARHQGHVTESQTVTIISGQARRQDFSLKSSGGSGSGLVKPTLFQAGAASPSQVRGRITDAKSGKPVESATVTIDGRKTLSSSTGSYSLNSIPAGTVTMTVEKSGYQDISRRIAVLSGKTTTVDLRMIPSAPIQLRNKLPLTLSPVTK